MEFANANCHFPNKTSQQAVGFACKNVILRYQILNFDSINLTVIRKTSSYFMKSNLLMQIIVFSHEFVSKLPIQLEKL